MYRVIRSASEEQEQLVLPYALDVLQDCAKTGALIPGSYTNNQTGEDFNFMYIKSVVAKSGNVYMCPVYVGLDDDALLFGSSGKIKVSLRQIELGEDRTDLEWENVDPKFTLDYVTSRTKQWLNSNLRKLVGRVAPVMSRRYRPMNRYGSYLWIHEDYEYVMLVDKADYDVKTDKNGIPNFKVNLSGHLFDVSATDSLLRYKVWKQSDSLYPYYLGYDSITVPLESVARVTLPESSADFPSKDIVLDTIDNLNLSKNEIEHAMSELINLAEKGSYIPCATDSSVEAWLVTNTYNEHTTPYLIMIRNSKPLKLDYYEDVVFWKDNNGYAVQYRDRLFYLNDAKKLPDDADPDYLFNTYFMHGSCIDLNKVHTG